MISLFRIVLNVSPFSPDMIVSQFSTCLDNYLEWSFLLWIAMYHFFASGNYFIDVQPTSLQFEISRKQRSHDHLNLTTHFRPRETC